MQKLETRVPFQDQMCQGVIVDTLSSSAHSVQTFTKSLLRSVTLAASVRGAARVPALGLLALGRAPTVCWPMQEPRGRLDRLHTAAAQLLDRARLDPSSAAMEEDGAGRLEFALDIVNTQFGDFCSKQAQTGGRLQLTVLTSDPEVTSKLRRWSRAAATDAAGLQRIQVFEVVRPGELSPDVDVPSDVDADVDADGDVEAVPLDVARTYGDATLFDQHFQSWLLEQSTASEHVRLLLPPLEAPLSLHCDMQAALVSPLSLPFTHRLLLTSEKTGWHAGGRGEVPIHQLEVTGRVPRAGLCQSVIHGEPVLLRATSCWNQSWDQLVTNTQSVRSLCSELAASGEVLLARLAGGRSHPDVSGRFAVMPASCSAPDSSGTLLMCALAPAELVLPPGGASAYCADGAVPQLIVDEIQGRLSSLPRHSEYNPLEAPSGLSEALAALSQKPSAAHQTHGQAGGAESGRSGHNTTSAAAAAPAPARGGGAAPARGGGAAPARGGGAAPARGGAAAPARGGGAAPARGGAAAPARGGGAVPARGGGAAPARGGAAAPARGGGAAPARGGAAAPARGGGAAPARGRDSARGARGRGRARGRPLFWKEDWSEMEQ